MLQKTSSAHGPTPISPLPREALALQRRRARTVQAKRLRFVLATLLADLRARAGWTLEELAARARCPEKLVAAFEVGKRGDLISFGRLSMGLGQAPDRLLELAGELVKQIEVEPAAQALPTVPMTLEDTRTAVRRLLSVDLVSQPMQP